MDTHRSAAPAAAAHGGNGSAGGGKDDTVGGKRLAPSPSALPGNKRSKAEAEVKELEPALWAKMLSLYRQTPHVLLSVSEISVGRSHKCHIVLDDQTVDRNLCLLQHLEQGGSWELEVTGKGGLVVVNGTQIIRGAKVPLSGGDEINFGRSRDYIFQHPLTGPNILAYGHNNLGGHWQSLLHLETTTKQ